MSLPNSPDLATENAKLRARLAELEEALRARQTQTQDDERFRALADAIPQLAWIAHADGFIHWYNRRWYEYTGTTPQQMEGWGWQSVHDPEVLPQVLKQWKQSIGTGKPFDMIFPLRGADGQFRRFLTRVQPLKNDQGEVAQWFGTNTDVDELARTEEALRASEKKLALALRSAGMGTWRLDLREQDREFDDQVCRCLGIDPARFRGTPEEFFGAVHPGDHALVKAALDRTVATGAPYESEYRAVWPDGSIHYIAGRGQLARDAAGQPQAIDGLVWDVTERKQAEEAVRLNEDRLRFALETSHTGAWDLDLVDHGAFRSLEHDRIFGYPEVLPHWSYETFLEHVLPEDREAVDAKFQEATRTHGDWKFECRIRRPDGEVRWIWAAGRHRADAAGGMRRMAGIIQDITERKAAEAELQQRADELRATNHELERFNRAMLGREMRVIELKQELNDLYAQLGKPARYTLHAQNGKAETSASLQNAP
jgi:PAS domain S-box-containing protein